MILRNKPEQLRNEIIIVDSINELFIQFKRNSICYQIPYSDLFLNVTHI